MPRACVVCQKAVRAIVHRLGQPHNPLEPYVPSPGQPRVYQVVHEPHPFQGRHLACTDAQSVVKVTPEPPLLQLEFGDGQLRRPPVEQGLLEKVEQSLEVHGQQQHPRKLLMGRL